MVGCNIYVLLLSGAINACGALILAPVLPFFAMGAGASAFDLAMISSVYSLFQMMSSLLLGTLSDKLGRKPIMIFGLTLRTCLYFCQSYADTSGASVSGVCRRDWSCGNGVPL